MSNGPHHPALHLVADLRVDVDDVHAQVRADGSSVTVRTTQPVRLVRAALRSHPPGAPSRRASLATVADALADQGLDLVLEGPRGRLGSVGHGVDSSLGGALLGTRRAKPHVPVVVRWALAAGAVGAVGAAARRAF